MKRRKTNRTKVGVKPRHSLPDSDECQAMGEMKPKFSVPDPGEGSTNALMESNETLSDICRRIQEIHRQYKCNLRSRLMLENRTRATVAVAAGYYAGMEEATRAKMFKEADATIKRILAGEVRSKTEHGIAGLVRASSLSNKQFDLLTKAYAMSMAKLAEQLPVAEWMRKPEQHGFGFKSLATIIGEAGNLSNYPNPAKLWRRMGCAPFASGDRVHMGSQWKRMNGRGLSSTEWEEYGYSPSRRSVVFQLTEPLLKLNGRIRRDGLAENEISSAGEWRIETEGTCAGDMESETKCVHVGECDRETERLFADDLSPGTDKRSAGEFDPETEGVLADDSMSETDQTIVGDGDERTDVEVATDSNVGPYRRRYDEAKAAKVALQSDEWPTLRCHRHALLLMGKLLLKNLWIEWHRTEGTKGFSGNGPLGAVHGGGNGSRGGSATGTTER